VASGRRERHEIGGRALPDAPRSVSEVSKSVLASHRDCRELRRTKLRHVTSPDSRITPEYSFARKAFRGGVITISQIFHASILSSVAQSPGSICILK